MNKAATFLFIRLSLALTFGATSVAFAENSDILTYNTDSAVETQLYNIEIERVLNKRAEERQLAQQAAPDATFIGFTKIAE